ncbi:MAG: nucleoside hydrolase [Woeseiaceae bacterium]|nr:nucleoside hydrolase [Woeseiaceae bacterium]
MRRRIIIDCDPGQDDAIGLFLAFASRDELDLLGVTTVAGNVPLALTQQNARQMCDIANVRDVPVFAGCDRPLRRALLTAEHVHGRTGIDGVDVIDPLTPLNDQHAVDFIIESLRQYDAVTLVPTGPMTNIATVIQREPALLPSIERIVLMGGAMREGGNYSPSAEFNVLVDPDAADIVFSCGRPITAFGLDVTHKVLSTRERVARIRGIGNAVSDATAGMLSFFQRHDSKKYGADGAPLHDPCTVAWLLKPELFKTKPVNVSVETDSELTIGHTAVDFWHVTSRPVNVDWAYDVDADGFYELLFDRLARFGGET